MTDSFSMMTTHSQPGESGSGEPTIGSGDVTGPAAGGDTNENCEFTDENEEAEAESEQEEGEEEDKSPQG